MKYSWKTSFLNFGATHWKYVAELRILTYSPAKKQPLSQIRKFNFEISLALGSILLCLKCIDMYMIDPHLDPPMGYKWPQSPKNGKI